MRIGCALVGISPGSATGKRIVQVISAGPYGVVNPPTLDGNVTGDDSLLATLQMPAGIPVATVAIDGSLNAALLVVEMLAISDEELAEARRVDMHGRDVAPRRDRVGENQVHDLVRAQKDHVPAPPPKSLHDPDESPDPDR